MSASALALLAIMSLIYLRTASTDNNEVLRKNHRAEASDALRGDARASTADTPIPVPTPVVRSSHLRLVDRATRAPIADATVAFMVDDRVVENRSNEEGGVSFADTGVPNVLMIRHADLGFVVPRDIDPSGECRVDPAPHIRGSISPRAGVSGVIGFGRLEIETTFGRTEIPEPLRAWCLERLVREHEFNTPEEAASIDIGGLPCEFSATLTSPEGFGFQRRSEGRPVRTIELDQTRNEFALELVSARWLYGRVVDFETADLGMTTDSGRRAIRGVSFGDRSQVVVCIE